MGKVRILAALVLDGIGYVPNQVVDMPAAAAKQLAADGQVDPHKDAVAYCTKELGAEVIVHKSPEVVDVADKAAADKAGQLADLEAKLRDATDDEKPALLAQLDALKAQ